MLAAFFVETGSELIYRSVRMFHDATRLEATLRLSERGPLFWPMSMEFLRAKRGQVSSSFNWLAMGIHLPGWFACLYNPDSHHFWHIVEGVYQEAWKMLPAGRWMSSASTWETCKCLTLSQCPACWSWRLPPLSR
jgi:hypothetical protein